MGPDGKFCQGHELLHKCVDHMQLYPSPAVLALFHCSLSHISTAHSTIRVSAACSNVSCSVLQHHLILAEHCYLQVLMARYQGNDAVLKLLVTPMADLSAHEKQNVEQELAVLRSLQHPNIVQVGLSHTFYLEDRIITVGFVETLTLQDTTSDPEPPFSPHSSSHSGQCPLSQLLALDQRHPSRAGEVRVMAASLPLPLSPYTDAGRSSKCRSGVATSATMPMAC